MVIDYQRNQERYQFIRWAQDAFDNFRVVPPGKGIVHQINLEYLANVVSHQSYQSRDWAFPDTLFGTDSHTTMINGLGVLGWGVGGIEAIAALLGKPTQLVLPDVIGLTFHGSLSDSATPTDLTLMIVERLRQEGVVGKFIECFGSSLDRIPVPDRSMIANMSPETGATVIFFPVDVQTLDYLKLTGRSPHQLELIEIYCKKQGLFRTDKTLPPQFTEVIDIDLSKVKPSLSGPFRPQDRLEIPTIKQQFYNSMKNSRDEQGFGLQEKELVNEVSVMINGQNVTIRHGSLLLAAITSCTNTSNPMVMLAAGLLAKNAVERGMEISPAIKCSLMPGSQVVTAYLENAGLLDPLSQLGFTLVGYGCGTCIGNSGPLPPEVVNALTDQPLITASISSGNRNFEGRIHPLTKANYLASPPLVVAYALAGRIDIDLTLEPLGTDTCGNAVFLKDIYPTQDEIEGVYHQIQPDLFKSVYEHIFNGDKTWQEIFASNPSALYPWNGESTYITEPPYFKDKKENKSLEAAQDIEGARILVWLGDSITTDHISPAGVIQPGSPAGLYLKSLGVSEKDFNTYGARRGNDQVMTRGTFANIRLKNRLVLDKEGGFTRHFPSQKIMTIFNAAQKYKQENVPLIIIAGKEYGTGSSRDWAAKGPYLLGVRAIIAESFERIHRANLVGMGVLPLQFMPGENTDILGLRGDEKFDLLELSLISPGGTFQIGVRNHEDTYTVFDTLVRIETNAELASYFVGGILHEALL
jgi:aconitate hydratase